MGQSKVYSVYGIALFSAILFTGILPIPGFLSQSNEIIDDSIQEFTFGLIQLSSATFLDGISVITSITSVETDTNGNSGVLNPGDSIDFTLLVPASADVVSVSGSYNSVLLSWSTNDGGETWTATYTVVEGHSDISTPTQISGVTVTDDEENTSAPASGTGITSPIDANTPFIDSVTSDATSAGALKVGDTITFTATLVTPESGLTVTSDPYNAQALTWTEIDATGSYSATYTVTEGEDDQDPAIQVTGVTTEDAAGNSDTADGADVTQTIDANRPFVIEVNSNIDSMTTPGTIADRDVGVTLDIIPKYNEDMLNDNTADPEFTFSPNVDSTLGTVPGTQSWISTTDVSAPFTIADAGVDENTVDVMIIKNAKDAAGNTQIEYLTGLTAGPFGIDTLNPTIPAFTLTIASSNTHDAGVTAATQVATSGDTITVTLDASEPLDSTIFIQPDDVVIQGVGDSNADVSVSIDDSTLTAVLTVDILDTEGVTSFTIQARDVFGNEIDADTTSPNVPEPATNAHITDGSQVILDYTAPTFNGTFEIVGTTTANDPTNIRTFSRAVTLVFDCNDNNSAAVDVDGNPDETAVAGCFEANVADDGATFRGFTLFTDETTDDATLTSERETKTVLVQYRDRAGNSDDTASRTSDDIELDAFFQNVVVGTVPASSSADISGEWEDFAFDVSGEIVHPQVLLGPQDKIQIDFNFLANTNPTFDFPEGFTHPSNIVVVDITSTADPDTFSFTTSGTASREYPRPTQDQVDIDQGFAHLHTPETTLVLNDGTTPLDESVTPEGETDDNNVDEETVNKSIVLERSTSINTVPLQDAFAGQAIFIVGKGSPGLEDGIDGNGIPGKSIDFVDGSSLPNTGLTSPVTTHSGLILEDDAGVTIAAGVAQLQQPGAGTDTIGSKIKTAHIPGFVALTINNLGLREVELLATDGLGNQFSVSDSSGDLTNPFILTVSDEDGVSEIQVIEIRDVSTVDPENGVGPTPIPGATLDISKIQTYGHELENIDDISFDTDFPDVETATTKWFDIGFFFSEGNADDTPAEGIVIESQFNADNEDATPNTADDDPDYLSSSFSDAYDILFNNAAGFGTLTNTIRQDSGVGIGVQLCAGEADADNDGICDEWETLGVPFWSWGAVNRMPLDAVTFDFEGTVAGTPTTVKDVYIEIDYMKDQPGDGSTTTGDHTPDANAIQDVVDLFEANGINLHVLVDETIPHHNIINMWEDSDANPRNDFNGIKSINLGHIGISPRITGSQINTVTADATPGDYTITINGMTWETPCHNFTTPPNRMQGLMQSKIFVTMDAAGTVSLTPGEVTTTIGSGGGFFYSAPRVVAINHFGNLAVILFDAEVSAGIAFGNDCNGDGFDDNAARLMDDLTIPISVSSANIVDANAGTPGIQLTTPSPFPKATSNLEKAWSQVYRYLIWAHSYGGPSGLAEERGNDAVVTLGDGFGTSFNGHPGGTRHEQAGTFAHEVGHLLNLGHGGPKYLSTDPLQTTLGDTSVNCKPLYGSIMSYSRQLPTSGHLSLTTNADGSVASASEWQLSYSDGTRGINPIENIVSSAGEVHVTDLVDNKGAIVGGFLESSLVETTPLPGTLITIIWGTPTTASSHANPHSLIKAPSNVGHDWNDSDVAHVPSGTVSADINNFGISGCGPTSNTSTYYDYDDVFHMDLDFKQGPSGQFDGISVGNPDPDKDYVWQGVLKSAIFDGIDNQPQDGLMAKGGSAVNLEISLTDENGNTIELQDKGLIQIFASKDKLASNTSPGSDPRTEWIKLLDHNTNNPDPSTMLWNAEKSTLTFTWKTPNNGNDLGFSDLNIEGDWFIKAITFNRPNAGDPLVCDTSDPTVNPGVDSDGDGTFEVCLAGEEDNPSSNFLIDTVDPAVPGTTLEPGKREFATYVVMLTKGQPSEQQESPPAEQDVPEVDNLIGTLNALIESKEVKTGTGNQLRDILNDAKSQFILFDDTGEQMHHDNACGLIDQFEIEVDSEPNNQVSASAKAELITGSNGSDVVQQSKGCTDSVAP